LLVFRETLTWITHFSGQTGPFEGVQHLQCAAMGLAHVSAGPDTEGRTDDLF
jgi:hypothetical protein